MKRSLALSLCTVAMAAFAFSSVHADDIDIDLEFSGGAWQLYAEVIITPSTSDPDGSLGISAIRALIDNINFGTGGNGVVIAAAGAINPIDAGGPNERDPVLQKAGGTLDIIYGQDISTSGTIVGGVGVGGRDLIASGTYSGTNPAFGTDGSLTTQGLFLTSTTPGGGNAIDPGNNILNISSGTLPGDYDASGAVGQGDLDLVLLNWGSTAPPIPTGWVNQQPSGLIGQGDLDGVLLNWGNVSVSATFAAVPEPTSLALGAFALVGLLGARRRR